MSHFNGSVPLDDKLKGCTGKLWTKNKKDVKSFVIWDLKPEAIFDGLNRIQKRELLRQLATIDKYPKRAVEISDSTLPDKLCKEKELSCAAILIISLALKQGREPAGNSNDPKMFSPTSLFAELVGCASPDTVEELSPYLLPPLITLEKLPVFIYCAVRQYVSDIL
jgi:hypothetical protein